MLIGQAAIFYYNYIMGKNYSFNIMLQLTKAYFKTNKNRQLYISKWQEIIFQRVIASNPIKTYLEYLQLFFNKL